MYRSCGCGAGLKGIHKTTIVYVSLGSSSLAIGIYVGSQMPRPFLTLSTTIFCTTTEWAWKCNCGKQFPSGDCLGCGSSACSACLRSGGCADGKPCETCAFTRIMMPLMVNLSVPAPTTVSVSLAQSLPTRPTFIDLPAPPAPPTVPSLTSSNADWPLATTTDGTSSTTMPVGPQPSALRLAETADRALEITCLQFRQQAAQLTNIWSSHDSQVRALRKLEAQLHRNYESFLHAQRGAPPGSVVQLNAETVEQQYREKLASIQLRLAPQISLQDTTRATLRRVAASLEVAVARQRTVKAKIVELRARDVPVDRHRAGGGGKRGPRTGAGPSRATATSGHEMQRGPPPGSDSTIVVRHRPNFTHF